MLLKLRKVVLALLMLSMGVLFSACAAMDSYYATHDPNDDYTSWGPGYGYWYGSPNRANWDSYYGRQGTDMDMLYDFGPRRGD